MNSIDKEQQRLDAIISKRALGLHTSNSAVRTRRWPAGGRTVAPSSPPPPVPPRSPATTAVAAPPPEPLMVVPPPSATAIRSVSLDSKPRVDDEAHAQEPDDPYRAKCETKRLDRYISGEWRLARALRASNGGSGGVKTRAPERAAAAEQAERQHKEAHDVAHDRVAIKPCADDARKQAKETTGLLVNAIDELVYLLDTLDNGGLRAAGFDAVKALVIVQKAKAIRDLLPGVLGSTPERETCGGLLVHDTDALVGSVARFVKGWRDGNIDVASSTALTNSAGSIASQATTLQHQLRRQIVIADA